jgi:protocatechuate 3,4-dioxygenase beta subunit
VRDLADLENLRISVSRGDVLHVETIDVSGAPVPGAPVQLHLPSGESRSIGRTDAQGRATVVRPQGISESQLTASTSDWPVMISPVLTSAESTVQVQAIPVAGLAIRVVEESGDPVPGAMISGYADIDLVGKGARQFPGRLYNLRGISGATDEEGRLEISRAPLCALELEVYRRVGTEYRDLPTNERIDLSGPTVSPEVTIVLRAPEETTIRGKVVNEEGAPVGGAVVREAFRPPTDEEAPTTTNMDGRFEIRVPMRNGEARIYAAAEGYLGGSWRGPPTEEEVSITLPRGIRLHGRIARSEADGAEQVWLYPFTPSQGWSEGWRRHYHEMSVNFPADATEVPFSWDLPKQGWGETTVSLFLMAVSSDKEVGTGVSELQVETQTDYDLGTLFLRPECTVSGIVEDSDGNPLGGATVMWEESNPQQYYSSNSAIRRWQDTTGSSGRFSLSALPPETSRLVVTREGYHGRSEPVLLPREEDVRIALHRPEGATITIEVIDRDGAPLAGIQSTLTLDDLNSVRATDHRGRAEHEEVPPGEYRLTLSLSQGEGSLNATAMVEMGDTDRTLTFDMRQWFHVAGFLMRGGEAQTQQYMNTHTSWAMGEHMDSINGWMRTNEVGAFDFTLPPGTVRLSTQSGASMELEVTADIEDLVWDLDASN